MSWIEFSSDRIGIGDRFYSVGKYPIRRQWSLNLSTPGMQEIAAYFRTEEHARRFAETFGLTITDHRSEP